MAKNGSWKMGRHAISYHPSRNANQTIESIIK
ncbi:Uncharacterised protein [Vibrio cholerae]|nr:Uncharacterised protein [Vibrio cholerae]